MTHLIVGYGEVGQGLMYVINKDEILVSIHDPQQGKEGYSDPDRPYDVMHICFPYSHNFISEVNEIRQKLPAKLIIIHSTVQVGTTRTLGDGVAYSFVRGRHPNLGKDMTHHCKHIGAVDPDDAMAAFMLLTDLGFLCQIQSSPEAVELGKLWDTTYYGICIAATKLAKEMADHYAIPWHDLAQMNKSYNLTAEPQFIRPQLEPIEGPIGGHCVIPNTHLLGETFDHPLLAGVLRYAPEEL